jgi:transcriptional regulator with PAS, ATPase and Fis domain
MKTLVSWLAYNNDFKDGKVDLLNSPNYIMHNIFWTFDRHIILCSASGDDTRAEHLIRTINADFPDHEAEIRYMNVPDVINLSAIKTKVESFLLSLRDDSITIFFSPGTSIMQLTWYICHTTLGLQTKLIQTRPASKSKNARPELLEIRVEKSSVPITSIIKEILAGEKGEKDKEAAAFLLTESLKPVYERAGKIAQTDKVTVLINGETGTGKEHLARYIHDSSARKPKPYLAINCSAFNDELLIAELFGYKKGAYTGAEQDTKGIFEMADGGTIFMDEVADISPKLQQTLLRVMQTKEIQPLQMKPRKVDVRVIAATNKNLPELCREGRFRWDLYYRLAIAELELPALIERGTDETEEMIKFFLRKKSVELKKGKILKLTPEVMQILRNHTWPGNVRELENLIETLYVFCDDDVSANDLPARFKETAGQKSLRWDDVEKDHIEYVLKIKKGNQRQAWLALGYGSINTLRSKINNYGIEIEEDSACN